MVGAFLILTIVVLIFQLRQLYPSYEYGWIGTLDFIEYWSAGQLFIEGSNPYNFEKLYNLQLKLGYSNDYPMIMWNPPWLLIWIFPILLLPFMNAAILWLLMSLILTLLSGTLIWRTLAPKRFHENIIIPIIATITFLPLLFTLVLGQISSLVIVGLAGFIYFIERKRHFLAGLFLSLSLVKPHVIYLVWIAVAYWIITERDWRLMLGVCLVMIPSIVALWIVMPDWLFFYYEALKIPPLHWTTPTAGTFLRLIFLRDWPQVHFLPIIFTGLLFIGFLLKRRPKLVWKKVMPPLLIVSFPTASYGWSFDQIILLIPYLYIVIKVFGDEAQMERISRFFLGMGLVIIEIGILMQRIFVTEINDVLYNFMKLDNSCEMIRWLRLSHELFYFWVPWALGIVYVLTYSRDKTSRSLS
jgi:hypothetical protein